MSGHEGSVDLGDLGALGEGRVAPEAARRAELEAAGGWTTMSTRAAAAPAASATMLRWRPPEKPGERRSSITSVRDESLTQSVSAVQAQELEHNMTNDPAHSQRSSTATVLQEGHGSSTKTAPHAKKVQWISTKRIGGPQGHPGLVHVAPPRSWTITTPAQTSRPSAPPGNMSPATPVRSSAQRYARRRA